MRKLAVALSFVSCSAVAGVTVETEGSGNTFEKAKDNAFRSAIQQVVGTVVISNREVKDNQLTRDEISDYSAGFIEDYEILESYQDESDRYVVHMTVKVADSKIAQRMLTRAEDNKHIHGPKVYDSVKSEIDMRDRGTRVLTEVLNSYPQNAYVINSGQSEFKVGVIRQPYVDFDYSITMSRTWVEAFNEAVSLVATNSKSCNTLTMSVAASVGSSKTSGRGVRELSDLACGSEPDVRVFYKAKGDFLPKAHSYRLPDYVMLDTINSQFQAGNNLQYIALKVDLLNASGNVIDSRCSNINNHMFISYNNPPGDYNARDRWALSRPNVMGQNKLDGSVRLHLKTVEQLEDLARIRLSIEKTCN